jgi:hypothetical protein
MRVSRWTLTLALSTFAALQGGLQLTQTMQSSKPLHAALDGALTALRAAAVDRLKVSEWAHACPGCLSRSLPESGLYHHTSH